MTVRVTQKMRKRIAAIKRETAIKRELVTDHSYKDIHKRGFIYETPDHGKTIYRQPVSYCDVSGVRMDKGEQLQFDFKENEVNERAEKMENIFDKLNNIESQVREVRKSLIELSYNDNN